ncbi:uncharacterized protein LOC9632231 isoform X1 [Selaginella moellendorffii]|uniref:uncharacterized protein LOC9632231 isoform X1 n=1 Tax=Selaginella moellendorffii TaxID=88036 RepID=UPI000D1C7E64|nr:uncharacterized protein LOC9632231 isoform X1 [Selaginella moellendorffii]|eukprot:XP_024524752.1 uncharacterized protein LOC9632231 isoform X1 [Selaginella moellendorffii]
MAVTQYPPCAVFSSSTNRCRRAGGGKRRIARINVAAALAYGDWSGALPGELPGSSSARLNSISDFTRFLDKGDQGAELQTAIVSYAAPKKNMWSLFQPQVQYTLLIKSKRWNSSSASDIGLNFFRSRYFRALQNELDAYDAVLYEMVAEKGKNWKGRGRWKPPNRKSQGKNSRKNRSFSFVGAIQRLMAQVLSLDFQLECMDYQKDNWYHADLDFETFQDLQRRKGESLFGFATEMTKISTAALSAAALARTDLDQWRGKLLWASRVFPMPLLGLFVIEGVCAPPDAPLSSSPEMKALFNLELAAATKLFLAKQLSTDLTEGAFSLLKDSVIIGERNSVAMRELEAAIAEGCEKIAIFYGSGHLPDMDSRLRSLGFFPQRLKWQTAWSIQSTTRRSSSEKNDNVFSLATLTKITNWPLNRYETLALILFSSVLAVDLWFWEACLETINESGNHLLQLIASSVQI